RRTISTTIQPMFFSTISCVSFMAVSPSSRYRELLRLEARDQSLDSLDAGDRAHDVVGHDQHAAEEQRSSKQPDRIERVRRLHRLDERVGERAVRICRAPHEAL